MINLDAVIADNVPALKNRPTFRKLAHKLLNKLLHIEEINDFLEGSQHYEGFDFLERTFDWLNIRYSALNDQIENIPAQGRVVVVANHPLGSIDGLILLDAIGRVRKDVKIVVNQLLMHVKPLQSLALPVDAFSRKTSEDSIANIEKYLADEHAVIFFPSGEVSRTSPQGIQDPKWRSGFMRFALKTRAPILPIHVKASNSKSFYFISQIFKPLSTVMLAREMFKQGKKQVDLTIGQQIPIEDLEAMPVSIKEKVQLIKKHVYRIGKKKEPIFNTVKAIAHPEKEKDIREELMDADLLIEFPKERQVYVTPYLNDSSLMREIGRLREVSFREVGEGSGERRDIDDYDRFYKHILLWDKNDHEIMGAYRLGEASSIYNSAEEPDREFYSQSLFQFSDAAIEQLQHGLEFGRSFVQPKYWGSNALDLLWNGLGAFVAKNPDMRYLFGPVSISRRYPKAAMDLLVYYYTKHYCPDPSFVRSRHPYVIDEESKKSCEKIVLGDSIEEDMSRLKAHLSNMDMSVPVLYRKYTMLCEDDGIRFYGFGVDPDFGYCIDGFMVLDVTKFKPSMYKRFIGKHKKSDEASLVAEEA